MKFAHMADCHIGAWRHEKLRALTHEAFTKAVDVCLEENVDFVLIAGDFFNTAIPSIEAMHHAVKQLQRLKANTIPVYLIAGSHDYAATGRTMLDVLEEAGLFINVFRGSMIDGKIHLKPTIDSKTKATIVGVPGKAGMLDRAIYQQLATQTLAEGFRIFMFHTALAELSDGNPNAPSQPLSLLPKGYNYYAGGHVHIVASRQEETHGLVVYPGPLFPADFAELEKLQHGGFFIYDNGKLERKNIPLRPLLSLTLDVSNKTVAECAKQLQELTDKTVTNHIVTLRVHGEINGNIQQLRLDEFSAALYARGAYAVLKNTAGITTPDFAASEHAGLQTDEIERKVIEAHVDEFKSLGLQKEEIIRLVENILSSLSFPRAEGESKADYEQRMLNEAKRILEF